jgi:hypothetical protein
MNENCRQKNMSNNWITGEVFVLLTGPGNELRLMRDEDDEEYYWKE